MFGHGKVKGKLLPVNHHKPDIYSTFIIFNLLNIEVKFWLISFECQIFSRNCLRACTIPREDVIEIFMKYKLVKSKCSAALLELQTDCWQFSSWEILKCIYIVCFCQIFALGRKETDSNLLSAAIMNYYSKYNRTLFSERKYVN